MRAIRFVSCFITGILLAASLAVRADETGQNTPPAGQLEASHGQVAAQGARQESFAIGGPIGVLTDEQRASYEKAMNAERGKMTELQVRLRAARQDLLATSVTQKFDENLVRQKAMAVARTEAELTVLRVKVLSQVQPPLSPEQVERIKAGPPGQLHPFERRQLDRPQRREAPAETNRDINGLPPKQ